jgi:hypothetical protein
LITVPIIFPNHQNLSKHLSVQVPGTFSDDFTAKALFELPSALRQTAFPEVPGTLRLSPEALEALSLGLADRTDGGRALAGAEIAADPAPPDGESGFLAGASRRTGRTILRALFLRWAALRDGLGFLLASQYLIGDVEGTIAISPVQQVRVAVVAGADDVQVLLLVPRRQPTGTGPVAVPLFVDEQSFHQIPGKLPIRVKVVSRGLGLPVQSLVESVHFLSRNGNLFVHSPNASLIFSGRYPTTHLESPTTTVGKDTAGFHRRI